MNEKELQNQLQTKVKKRLAPLFTRYKMDFSGLEATMKWKPIVLVIGSYSSGKSTLINELVGQDVQRTGQAPTDDSFTVITSDLGVDCSEVPGSTLISDSRMPFDQFKKYGERLISHMRMKYIDSPVLENMSIIDSPGMLDATSEKGRGYDYLAVLGEFAKIADLIVLMFDPHKAGTIKESYTTIRNTLPEKSGEDRIVFVMSRIDECDSLSDFTRSYGTLCWNMSQMTGRKDIPHIYLTYSPSAIGPGSVVEGWPQERRELIDKINSAPSFRINHILEDIDRKVNELQIVAEAVAGFAMRCQQVSWKITKITSIIALLLFLFGDVLLNSLISFPESTLITAVRTGIFSLGNLVIPAIFGLVTLTIGAISFSKVAYPQMLKKALVNGTDLVRLDNDYRRNLWKKMENKAKENLAALSVRDIWSGYGRSLVKIQGFLNNDLKGYYDKIVS